MKKRYKKLLCLALSGMLCMNTFSVTVFAEEPAAFSATDQEESTEAEGITAAQLVDAGDGGETAADTTDNEEAAPVISDSVEQEEADIQEEIEIQEEVIEEEAGMVVDAAADTIGLNVQNHSKEEIQAFFNAHPSLLSDQVMYAETPSLEEPYSPGRLDELTIERALNTINQIRFIAGISADVEYNEEYGEYVQAGSFLNAMNGILTHYPNRPEALADSSYDELYRKGRTGCSSSNIAWGYGTLNSAIIEGWMDDGDSSNIDRVGHRRWILNPYMKYTGFGKTGGYSAMFAHDKNNRGRESRVAWPAQVTPVEYFNNSYPWSVSVGSSVDISTTNVLLTRKSDGKTWSFSSDSSDGAFYVDNGGYGQPGCIIFRPNGVGRISAGNEFDVEISLKNGETIIAYSVEFFSLDTSMAPRMISTCSVQMSESVKGYGGSSLTPSIVIYDESTRLQEGDDYTITYNKDASGYVKEAVITGTDHYVGTITVPFTRIVYEMNGGNEELHNAAVIISDKKFHLNNPVRAGYAFWGWYDNPSYEGEAVASVTGNGEDVIRLYAKWRKFTKYTIQYDANGGTGGPVTENGEGIPCVSEKVPVRDGYEFEGWSRDASAEQVDYLPGDILPEESAFHLYAVWTLPGEIDFTSNPVTVDTRIVYNSQFRQYKIIPDSDATYVMESHGDEDSIAYLYDGNMNLITRNDDGGIKNNFRISAELKRGEIYYLVVGTYGGVKAEFQIMFQRPDSVLYDANGGQGAPENASSTGNDEGIPISDVIPSRNAKVTYNANGGSISEGSAILKAEFAGWNTKPDGSGDNYEPGETYNGTGDLRLYAMWKMPAIGTLPTPVYGEREFLGWYTSLTGTIKVTEETVVSGDMTLYARWSKYLEIHDQPESVQAAIGDKISFRVNAVDAKSYKWQYSKDGKTWSSSTIASASTNTLSMTVSETNAGNLYRCKVTGEDGRILYTDVATIDMLPGAVIIQQPVSVKTTIGNTVKYSVVADNVKDGGYQWYYSKDGSSWYKSTVASATSATMSIKASVSNKDNIYRCTITGMDGRKIKSSKTGMVIVNEQPKDVEAVVGKTAAFSVVADGIASYQWYYSKNQESWSKSTISSATTATLSMKVTDTNKNNYYRCKLTTKNGISVYTNEVRVIEVSAIKILSQPISVKAGNGTKVSFSVNATGVASWQWQYSKDGSIWKNSTISSASSQELKLTVSDSNRVNQYRCKLTGVDGSVRYTDVVSVK